MFNYQFPVSPYTIDLKKERGEHDAVPESGRQFQASMSWRTSAAVKVRAWARELASALKPAPKSQNSVEVEVGGLGHSNVTPTDTGH